MENTRKSANSTRDLGPLPLVILGSTGQVGRLAARLVAEHPQQFAALGLSAGTNLDVLVEQLAELRPPYVAVADQITVKSLQLRLRAAVPGYTPGLVVGDSGLKLLATLPGPVRLVNALSGAVGLRPTLDALQCGHTVALAHKESLVMAGELVMDTARQFGGTVIPLDSEHNAIWQCLNKEKLSNINKITLTCSGGPFVDGPADLSQVTPDQALRHPVWPMGRQISLDSATLINKGKEVIEAHHLFGLPQQKIEVLVHPEAAIHGMVTLCDGAVLSLLGAADMRLPLAHALAYPDRLEQNLPPPNLAARGHLTFREVDHQRFPGLNLCRRALDIGGTAPAALCAADEVAVEAFVAKTIPLTRIPELIEQLLGDHQPVAAHSVEAVLETYEQTAHRARSLLQGK